MSYGIDVSAIVSAFTGGAIFNGTSLAANASATPCVQDASSYQNGAGTPPWIMNGNGSVPTSVFASNDAKRGYGKSALPELADTGGAKDVSAIEDTGVTPESMFSTVKKELSRINVRLDSVSSELSPEVAEGYRSEIEVVETRIAFWQGELANLAGSSKRVSKRYAADIIIGERILLDRVLQLGAEIFSEPLPDELSGLGLRSKVGRRIQPRKKPVADKGKKSEEGRRVSALVNHDVGYGESLMLRPHQIMAHNKIMGLLRLRAEQLEDNGDLQEELLRGTVVMPVGGGKTRTMVAAFAAALAEGAFDPRKGDRCIILNHTERIHEQNLEVLKLLAPYFKSKVGRDLKITEYKADTKDLSGDIVVVSIPTVNNKDRREAFADNLKNALGESGQVVMAAVDEIHHLELGRGKSKESWLELVKTLRDVSPNFYRIGFTATPTGREGPYITRIRELDLMKAGVTPRTYLVKVEGEDLSQLKISKSARDVSTRQLVSVLLQFPKRNQRLYEALEQHGVRLFTSSPSGKERLEPVLSFAADLKHARMMADAYREYFGVEGDGLKGRKMLLLGGDKGKIGSKSLERALKQYEAGNTDGLIAIVSGRTKSEIRNKILKAVEDGKIETVFNVDVWLEGADLYMFTHQLGARPTFSRFKKGQERGRLNRRGPNDVGPKGELLKDPPKILFDVQDKHDSYERHLLSYGEVMGAVGYHAASKDQIFDVMSGDVVTEIDMDGEGSEHSDLESLVSKRIRPEKPAFEKDEESNLQPLMDTLWEILESQYDGYVESMALDLGIPPEEMTQILEGKGWINARWFLRRLATLLYQDRELLIDIYNRVRGVNDEKVTAEDISILREALAIYEGWEGPIVGGMTLKGDLGFGHLETDISTYLLESLKDGTVSDFQWRSMWQGLMVYFGVKAQKEGERQVVAQKVMVKLGTHFFEREGWKTEPANAQEELLFKAHEFVALYFGGELPHRTDIEGVGAQNYDSPLTKWLKKEPVKYSRQYTASFVYLQVRTFLVGLGMAKEEVDNLIEAAIFEEQGWDTTASDAQGRLLFEAHKLVARHFGGKLPCKTGIEGVVYQRPTVTLTKWLKKEPIKFLKSNTPHSFYLQVRALFVGLGMAKDKAEDLIEAVVFEEQGWDMTANDAQGRLLLEARKQVARHFGGVLPLKSEIKGMKIQRAGSTLTRWLNGEFFTYSQTNQPKSFYSQIRALLAGLGMEKKDADNLIEAAIFEEQGWDRMADSAQNRLLLAVRRFVAKRFGGVLFYQHGIDGVGAQRYDSPLTKWLKKKIIEYSSRNTPYSFYLQVRALLVGLGMKERNADNLIEAAIFEEQGWDTTATDAQGRLLLEAHKLVARHFGGVLPGSIGIEGVGEQKSHAPLTCWLKGGSSRYSMKSTPLFFYSQVKALLVGLGMAKDEADNRIEAAIFEERGWDVEASDAKGRLLLAAHKLVAIHFGGVLPLQPGIEGVKKQRTVSSLTKWLKNDEDIRLTASLCAQIRALLVHFGTDPKEADRLIEEARREA